MIRLLISVLLASSLFLTTFAVPAADEQPGQLAQSATAKNASQVIERFHNALIEAMKGGAKLGFEGRYQLLAPVIDASFDFSSIARLALGSEWVKLTPSQRQSMMKTLKEYTIANYASEFDSYSGERFKVDGQQQLREGIELVKSTFTSGNGNTTHSFDYLLHPIGGTWEIINVVVDGISDLSLKRAEYTQIIADQGFGALIHKLQLSIDRMASKNG
jgi:phospholipid transport system substrate-binding protein